jgi:uncharacterized protein
MQYPFWIRRPKTTLLLWFLFIVACMVPIAGPELDPSLGPVFPGLQMLTSIKGAIQSNDPDREFDPEMKKIFGDDEYAIIAVQNDNGVLNPETLAQVDRLTRAIKQMEGIRDIWSLTDMDHIRSGGPGVLDTRDLITTIPSTPEELKKIENEIDQSAVIPNYIISEDKKAAMIVAEIDEKVSDPAKRSELVGLIAKVVDEEKAKTPGKVHFAGIAVNDYYTGTVMNDDGALYMLGALLMVTLVMGLIFRKWQGVVATLAVWVVGLFGTLASIAAARQLMSPIVAFAPQVVVALTMGYSLYMLYGYVEHVYDEARAGRPIDDHRKLIYEAQQEEKAAFFFAVITTVIGMIALRTNTVPDLSAYGIFAGVAAGITGLCAYTLIPALLTLKPLKLDLKKPMNPWIQAVADKVAEGTLKRPWVHFGGALVVVAIGAVGLSMATVEIDIIRTWWAPDDPVRVDEEFVRDHTGGATILRAAIVTDKLDYFKEPENLKKLEEVQEFIKKQPHVTKTLSQADNVKLINKALHDDDPNQLAIPPTKEAVEQYLLLHKEPDDFRPVIDNDYAQAAIMVKMNTMDSKKLAAFEEAVEPFIKSKFPDAKDERVVGTTLLIHRAFDVIVRQTMNSVGLAVLLMAIVLWLMLRAAGIITIGKAMLVGLFMFLPNLAPLFVALGFFGLFGKPLNPTITVVTTAALGIAMDDTTHMFFTWLKNHKDLGMSPLEASAASVRRNGRPVLLTSIGVMCGFATLLGGRYLDTVWTALMFIIALTTAILFDMFFTPVLFSFMKFRDDAPKKTASSERRPAATV